MAKETKIYRKLQKHLNQQAIGYPRTLSSIDIDLLKYIFTKEEYVYTALNLDYKFKFIDEIYEIIKKNKITQKWGFSPRKDETAGILLEMRKIRSIGYRIRDDKEQYSLIPYYEGLFELQTGNMTEQFSKLHKKITRDPMYQLSVLNIYPTQHRTIPIESAVSPEHYVAPFNDVKKLVDDAEPPFLKIKCPCREVKKSQKHACKVSEDYHICLVMGDLGVLIKDLDMGIEIPKDEAIEILRRNQEAGLVLQPSNYKKVESICSCCNCCCGLLSLIKNINRPADYWTSHYYTINDPELCSGCGICKSRCPANAITINNHAIVDHTRCIGCGVCVPSCPEKAMTLIHKEKPKEIPETREDLHEKIYSNKKSFFGILRTAIRMSKGKKWV
jgi:ferredoxin